MEQSGRARSTSQIGSELSRKPSLSRSSSNMGPDVANRNRTTSRDVIKKTIPVKEDPQQVFMNTYGDIVTRTRQKLQIVKALKVMRKTKPAKHDQ
jgi:hypothetical protein